MGERKITNVCAVMYVHTIRILLFKIGGVEIDMVGLSESIRTCGGLQEVIDKNMWPKVAEMIKVPNVVSYDKFCHYSSRCEYLFFVNRD